MHGAPRSSNDSAEETKGPYFAVQGTQSAGGLTFTACIEGIAYNDPAAPMGLQIAGNLARYYNLIGSYRSFAGEGATCREKFPALNMLLSVSDYNNTVLPAVAGAPAPAPAPAPGPSPSPSPSPSPCPGPSPSPAPAPAPISPRACGSTNGPGVGDERRRLLPRRLDAVPELGAVPVAAPPLK